MIFNIVSPKSTLVFISSSSQKDEKGKFQPLPLWCTGPKTMKQGIDKSWTRVQTSLFKSYVQRGYFCFVLFIFLVFSHWAILISVLVIIRDLSQVYLKLQALHSWFLDMNWVTSQLIMTLDWNLRKLYLKCMERHGECGTLGSWHRSTPPEHCLWGFLGSRATLLSPALLREGGTGSALSQVSSLFQVPGLWPRRTEAGGFPGNKPSSMLLPPLGHTPSPV